MNYPKKISTAIFWLCVSVMAAQAQYRFDQWTTDNGLPQNSVNSIAQTSDGYLWLTTNDGLVRFDGVRFTVFNKGNSHNLPSNRLRKLLADGNDLWIITEENNFVRFRDGAFRQFTTADGLASDYVFEVIKESDGNILAFANEGVFRFENEQLSQVQGGKNFDLQSFRPYPSPFGTYWTLTKEKLTASKNGEIKDYPLPPGLKKIFETETFSLLYYARMLETVDGELWFSVGRYIYKLQNGIIGEVSAEGFPRNDITSIASDKRGGIWFGTDGNGACRLIQNRFDCFDSKTGLAGSFVTDIFSDREETLWIATNTNGVLRVTEQIITPLSIARGLIGKNIYPVFEDKSGAVWIGSSDGLSVFKDGKFTNYRKIDNLNSGYIQSFFEDRDGRLWIGCLFGLSFYKNGIFYDPQKTLGFNLGRSSVFDIYQDKIGVLWFAASDGLYKFDGKTLKILTTAEGLPGIDVKVILEAREDQTLWIGTYGGLAEIRDEKIKAYTEKDGLAGNHIRSLFEDEKGTLWIGTYDSGLSRFKDGKFTNYNKGNGLFSDGVFQILPDDHGNFWMSSNQGIYRVSRTELDEFADGKRQTISSTAYGKSDGMLSSEANGGGQPAGIKTSGGKLWFPTQDGVAIINPESVAVNPLPPPVVIENARIDNQNIADIQKEIEILPGQENLEIDYTGLSFIKPEQVRFRYKLAGLDENWTEAGARRTAFYPHLASGEYVFQVVAANSDNVWNETGASIKISVKPPFYRTWWFYAACLLLFLIVVYALYRVRVSQLERARRTQEEFSRRLINVHESERRRIAAELHDSIGQSLAMIKNRAVLGAESVTDENAKKQLDLITSQTTQTISEVREISYNLRPYLLDQLGLKKAILSLLNKLTETGNLTIQAEIDEIDNLFESEAEMSVYRIIQESLNNIVKHSDADEAQVYITKSDRSLTILIADNGKGFDQNAQHNGEIGKGGFGLIGMSERVRMLGGTQEIESTNGAGTTILIKIPLKENNGKSN